MSEQYAFAIGFDVESMHDQAREENDPAWAYQAPPHWEQVATAISTAGLPPIESERWDEFGLGRIFWGTKAECDAIHQILSQFDLYIEEARNLDIGYYTTANATYYVDEDGNIYSLPTDGQRINQAAIENILSIPLDAYRMKAVDPSLDAQMQSFLKARATPLATTPMMGVPEMAPAVSSDFFDSIEEETPEEDYTALRAQFKQQSDQIQTLEQQVSAFEDQVAALQTASAAKIDPEAHAALQQEHTALQAELTQTVEQMQTLQAQMQDLAATRVENPDAMRQSALLHEELAQQTTRITDLEAQLTQANTQTADWQQQLERAIPPETHQQIQQKLQEQLEQNQSLHALVQQLEQQVQQLTQQLTQQLAIDATQKIEVDQQRDSLRQELDNKTSLVADLRRTIHQLERDVSEWQTVAEAKVDWAEYQAIQTELQQLKVRQKRGLFSRLFGWIFR
jgi:hypothetical protein